MTSKKIVNGEEGDENLAGALRRTMQPFDLSARARKVLFDIVNADHARRRGRTLHVCLNDVELLRRAAKVEPPLSYERLRTRFARCGAVTAREICVALNLPVQPARLTHRVQCPRCGHCFGGGK
jgi:hypothetical protein